MRQRGKILYDHPENAIVGGRRGATPGSTFGQEFFLGLLLYVDLQWLKFPVHST